MADRRDVLKTLILAGALPSAFDRRFETVLAAAQNAGTSSGEHENAQAREFWETFLQRESVPASSVNELDRSTREGDTDREPFFFYFDKTKGCRPALSISADQLMSDGDLQVTMNVEGFKPSDVDTKTFTRLQNAQLRLDVIQTRRVFEFFDPMAWTVAAALQPTKAGKLPPLQDLSFNPTAASQSQGFMLPGGEGRWAINLTAQRKDSSFSQILRNVVPELGKFGPFLAFPAISVVALQSFNVFYGALHDMPVYLFKGSPVAFYGTSAAMQSSGSSKGIPLRTGTYVVVPNADAAKLPDSRLTTLDLLNGYLVPKGTKPQDATTVATQTLSDVTYATLQVSVKPTTALTDAKSKGGLQRR